MLSYSFTHPDCTWFGTVSSTEDGSTSGFCSWNTKDGHGTWRAEMEKDKGQHLCAFNCVYLLVFGFSCIDGDTPLRLGLGLG